MYWALASNMCGMDRDTFWLSLHPEPTPQLGPDTAMCYDQAYVLDAGVGISFLWHDGFMGQVYDVLEPGIYAVTVTNQHGCEGSDTVRLGISCLPEVYVPTGFTPNGDGLNDEFQVVYDHITDFRLSLFDRWGTTIFETTDLAEGWDGTFGGREMPIGSYVYAITYRDIVGIPYRAQGNVTLLR
jgi:gliding motility-associated-like protein